jgi:hypothetical protein
VGGVKPVRARAALKNVAAAKPRGEFYYGK